MQLSQQQYALQYEEALRSAAVGSIDPLLRELGGGAAPALEVEDFKSLGKTRVMILDANRQRLLRYCHISMKGLGLEGQEKSSWWRQISTHNSCTCYHAFMTASHGWSVPREECVCWM